MSIDYEYKGKKISIIKMPFDDTTEDGPFYAKVSNENIGINSRTHWDSESAAKLAAETYINAGIPE